MSRLTRKRNDSYIVDESNIKLETNGYSGEDIIKHHNIFILLKKYEL